MRNYHYLLSLSPQEHLFWMIKESRLLVYPFSRRFTLFQCATNLLWIQGIVGSSVLRCERAPG